MPVVKTPAKTVFSPFPTVFDGFSGGPRLEIGPTNQGSHRFRASSARLENGENGEKGSRYFSVILTVAKSNWAAAFHSHSL
jgi:hypothetical protein